MTAQVSDVVVHRAQEYALIAFSDGEPFVPAEHGFRPVMSSTACYRGYVCEYAITAGGLQLSKLHINHQEGTERASQLKQPPALNGIKAEVAKNSFAGRWVYSDLGLPIPYTGGLIIGRDFIRALYVHMGFHPAWKYQHVHELIFEAGALVSEHDVSERMASIRERLKSEPKASDAPSREGLAQWIEESFRRDYERK